jgi:hypothetical protein
MPQPEVPKVFCFFLSKKKRCLQPCLEGIRFMTASKLGILSLLALGAGIAPAAAQQVLTAPGIVVIVNPAPAAMPAMPDPMQMIAQMDAQMDRMMQTTAQLQTLTPAALTPRGTTGVMVTTVSDGAASCTRRIVYGAGQPAKIDVSETGNGCAVLGGMTSPSTPTALPAAPVAPRPAIPPTIQVRNQPSQPQTIMLADRDN